MARPKVPSTELRSVNFTIRITKSEQQQLVRLGEICGKAPRTLAREKIFKGRFPHAKMAKLDLNYYLELKKIGVNRFDINKKPCKLLICRVLASFNTVFSSP
jgi:hypothetical protein